MHQVSNSSGPKTCLSLPYCMTYKQQVFFSGKFKMCWIVTFSYLTNNHDFFSPTSLLKLHNVIILSALFSKMGPPILMKLCMLLGHGCVKKVRPLAPLVIAPFIALRFYKIVNKQQKMWNF